MGMYYLMILCGILTLLVAIGILKQEMRQRQERYRELLHTNFLVCNSDLGMELSCAHYVIGRRERRCDICLKSLKDRAISRVHAVLWYDGHTYCIAPVYQRKLLGKSAYTTLSVNGSPVPPKGCVLRPGDVIRMGNHNFTLEDSRKKVPS